MADAICRWRNGTPKTVVELVNSLPHEKMPIDAFRNSMSNKWNGDFFRTAYQLACQLALYCESEDGYYYPRFDHDINEQEAEEYLFFWLPRYYIPNPYTRKDGFQKIECPTFFLKELYEYTSRNPNCTYKEAYESSFQETAKNNDDIIRNYINSYSRVLSFSKEGILNITEVDPILVFDKMDRNNKKAFFDNFTKETVHIQPTDVEESSYRTYLTALRTKPFLLLAGISGTGKSRIVRELAFMSCPKYLQDKDGVTPGNYCMIEVKPNWHDSTELLGYYSNISKEYQFKKFVKFLVKAKMHPEVPFFVCLDEMNLAPVEQYFAEILSILETRKHPKTDEGVDMKTIKTEVIVEANYFKSYIYKDADSNQYSKLDMTDKDWYETFFSATTMTKEEKELIKKFQYSRTLQQEGLSLPDNVIIIGTVNMDETTHQFSRKVIDRAMTIEMNGGQLSDMFGGSKRLEYLPEAEQQKWQGAFKQRYVSADEVLELHPEAANDIKEKLPARLDDINKALKGTPFEVSYRVLNELVIMVAVMLDYNTEAKDIDIVINEAMDQILMMKVLPRIEGDDELLEEPLKSLAQYAQGYPMASAKIKEMQERLGRSHFTSFWP